MAVLIHNFKKETLKKNYMIVLVHKQQHGFLLVAHNCHKQLTTPTVEITSHTKVILNVIPLKAMVLKMNKSKSYLGAAI